jgi:cupin fold WbuC family metalloprotein
MSIPLQPVKQLDNTLVSRLCTEASASARKRTVFNFHESLSDPVQRFLNVMQPGTYVRPHRHDDPVKWEMTVILSGKLVVLIIDSGGRVIQRVDLDAEGPVRGVELPAGIWHTSSAVAADTVILEIKRGPYDVKTDKDFATWAPPEGSPECVEFEFKIRNAHPGDLLA